MPANAVTAGGQWRIDGGVWNNSGGTVSSLTVGTHTVSFKDVTGWTKPENKTVTIEDAKNTTSTGTCVQQFGSLKVNISPASAVTAGAKWRVDSGVWNNSDATVSNLTVGTHTLEYKDVAGWTKPINQTVSIQNNLTTTESGAYIQQFGSLTVSISPENAIIAGAQWQIDGGNWNNSGATVPNLTVGTHTVSFKEVTGWTKPANQTVTIKNEENTVTTGTYSQQFGSLTVSILPANAVSAGAKWRVDAGNWQNSGATVSSLNIGTHTVDFKDVSGWAKPNSQSVTIENGSVYKLTATYISTSGQPFVSRTLPYIYMPGLKFSVALTAIPDSNVSTYAIEDSPPAGWTVSNINEGGVFDSANNNTISILD